MLAINLMAVLSGEGHNAQYATGSKAFTRTLRRIVGTRAGQQFKYFNNYALAEPNGVDVLLATNRIEYVSQAGSVAAEKTDSGR